mmetsp:Transcript_9052/g.14851  ORF Transcript_9052/g.14851 Transcript_9052/m.14851 type:complete len:1200 (+) Transcript_9052:114-3713(+)|eukprot:CAMPEP_0184650292 /NCGR_PEP_ID=MMETSP0308-20130426/7791_1 /TAXON_ID=38269 /ORGANISM="Gloeochaete witrockiana, Strain SAG 46.84" /LENGTH=1199 /DNA_ID=CAMNT_0027083707 /DNA_START=52 /DNA_END=3651 /DNA_ORIENTATION=+
MFIYLSKKIAIPNGVKLRCVSWNSEQGWIACGGDNGLLKVLKLESVTSAKESGKGAASTKGGAPSNLSMNQTLEGHNGSVMCVTWNENFRKLTSSDQYGLIIVWMLHKGMWFEEMINNRNKSVVRDMKWTSDGQKICIVYEDGAVIVGSVDGNRLWGKELKVNLFLVAWAPDGRNILFCTLDGEVHLYDNLGNFITKIPLFSSDDIAKASKIVAIDWYDGAEGYSDPNAPCLSMAFDNGRVQLNRQETDEKPVLIDTGMRVNKVKWNSGGTVLAVTGQQSAQAASGDARDISMVQFYSPTGQHLRTLKVPAPSGSGISAISWEGGGLRIALAVDSYIYFANIRPDYKWGYFNKHTLVYSFNKPERPESCVVFWDTKSDERYTKYVKKLMGIRASGENCVLATRADDNSGQFILILCNAIGSPVDSKYIDVEPLYLAMTPYHIVAASEDVVYVWQYRTSVSKLTSADSSGMLRRKEGRERVFHIDDVPSSGVMGGVDKFRKPDNMTSDAIACVAASDKVLLVGRESGIVHRYTLPHISLENKFVLRCRPQLLAINCNSTRMSIIDINGVLTFFDMEAASTMSPKNTSASSGNGAPDGQVNFERKDAWDMKWSDDNPELFAMMEKTRMYIFRGLDPEEPVLSNAYLCHFNDLKIRAVLLDDIMRNPEHPEKDFVLSFETKSLRDTRDILANVNIKDAYQFVEDNPHPRLWRILAEAALEQLNFAIADKAFVRCTDYQGIQFVKRLRKLDDKSKQKAEVCAYFKRFDEAEQIYREIDRKDLAIELRMRLGDWFRVVQLVQSGGGDDSLLTLSWNKIGDYYADRQKWGKAVHYYAQAKNAERLVDCYYILEDYAGLEKLITTLSDGSPLLNSVGEKFMSVGICEHAVDAFLKAGNIKAAIDCCVLLNQWDRAVGLAEENDFQQIEGLLSKYASYLLEKNKALQAIELYRKANRHMEAAKLLVQLAKEAIGTKVNPLRAKKLYVLAALEMERFRKKMLDTRVNDGFRSQTAATLDSLLQVDQATDGNRALDVSWRGAEATHFYLLAQRQLYEGMIDAAMKTALLLREYEDILDAVDVYSLIAITSFYNKFYGQCSKAFIKLESMDDVLSQQKRDAFAILALNIFTKFPPNDPQTRRFDCPHCDSPVKDWYASCPECGTHFSTCIFSGRAILDNRYYECRVCKHRAYEHEARGHTFCALCHSTLV